MPPSREPAHTPLYLAAVGLKKQLAAGINEPRLQYPLQALARLPGVHCVWGEGGLSIPPDFKPGVLMLNRQFMTDPPLLQALERKVREGWLLVADMDDDPMHWPAYEASGFLAFKGVHAVTVSTPELAKRIGVWNPHIAVLPNALPTITAAPQPIPKNPERLRLFFGAINRHKDWSPVMSGICAAAKALGKQVEWVVVHDQAFHDALPADSIKTFHPTLAPADYASVMATCDLALMPLADTAFNRCKSDVKLIEAAAAGVVPVCARVVYADNPEHAKFAVFADTPEEWAQALTSACQHPDRLNQRALQAHTYAKTQRMHAQQAPLRHALYVRWLAQRDVLEVDRQQRLQAMRSKALAAQGVNR